MPKFQVTFQVDRPLIAVSTLTPACHDVWLGQQWLIPHARTGRQTAFVKRGGVMRLAHLSVAQ